MSDEEKDSKESTEKDEVIQVIEETGDTLFDALKEATGAKRN